MRYCIGCKHLRFEDKDIGHGSTMTGSWTREEASMSCHRGHWKQYLSEGPIGFDLEKAMESADSCRDFKQRP